MALWECRRQDGLSSSLTGDATQIPFCTPIGLPGSCKWVWGLFPVQEVGRSRGRMNAALGRKTDVLKLGERKILIAFSCYLPRSNWPGSPLSDQAPQ